MAHIFFSDFKSCAVCDFWEGGRELNPFKDQVKVDSSSVRGKCLLVGAPWKGWDMKAQFFCSKWAKWAALE